jgi:hypothetical protein
MRPTSYQRLKKIQPGWIISTSRLVPDLIKSHRRPVDEETKPLIARPDDDPATRGPTENPYAP